MLDAIWFVTPAIAVIAQSRGFFAARGIEMRSRLTSSSDEQYEALAKGSCHVAVTAMDNVIGWNRRIRADFRIVAQIEATTPLTLVARPDITALSDLVDRKILVDSPDNGFVVVLHALLADAGMDFQANRIVRAGGVRERYNKLLAGEGDATLLGPPFDGMAADAGMRVLASVNERYPAFPGQGVVARQDTVAHSADLLVSWLAALEEARALGRDHPEKTRGDLTAAGFSGPVARALVAGIGSTLIPDPQGVNLLIAQRARVGLPGAESSYGEIVDARFLSGTRGSLGGI
jgi:ABC-type nitrate/sulfonate/bicarbonate transport system substrate-binding protein